MDDVDAQTIDDANELGLRATHIRSAEPEALISARDIIESHLAIRFGDGIVHYEHAFVTPFRSGDLLRLKGCKEALQASPSHLKKALELRERQILDLAEEFPPSRLRKSFYDPFDRVAMQKYIDTWQHRWGKPDAYQCDFHPDFLLGGLA